MMKSRHMALCGCVIMGLGFSLLGNAFAAETASVPVESTPLEMLDPHDTDFDATVKASSMVGLSATEQAQFTRLSKALRCLTCANNSLEDSQTAFSIQVKTTLKTLVKQHMTDEAIFQSLSSTYGDAILYAPPLSPKTVLLWLGPVLLGLILFIAIWTVSTRKRVGRHPRLEEALQVIRGEA